MASRCRRVDMESCRRRDLGLRRLASRHAAPKRYEALEAFYMYSDVEVGLLVARCRHVDMEA